MKSTAQSEGKQTSPDESQQKQSNSDLEPDQSAVRGIIPSAKAITVVAVLLAVLSVIALILVTWMGAHGPEIILEGLAKIVSGVLIAVSSAVLIGQISTAD